MNENTKNYLSWVLMAGIIVVAYSLLAFSNSYRRSLEPLLKIFSFTATGEGRAIAVPDIARFTFGVVTEGGADIARLQADNTAKVNKAIEFVKNQGVAAADIQTENYQVTPRYQSCNRYSQNGEQLCPPQTIVGYTVEQTITLKIRDFSVIGSVLSGVVQNGANRVWGLNFTVDNPTEFENRARAEAIANARAKAEAIAEAGGFNLGPLLSIDEGFYPVYAKEFSTGLGGEGGDAPPPTVEPGSSEIVVTVNLRYAIK